MRGALFGPDGEFERVLKGGAGVHRLAVRDDDALERKLQQGAQGGQGSLLMCRRCPNAELAAGRRQGVRENKGALLRQPHRSFVAAAPIVEGDEPTRKLAAWLDELQVSLGNVLTEKEARAEAAGTVT